MKDTYKNNEPLISNDITVEEIVNTLKRAHKRKSPETDKMTNFLLQYLASTPKIFEKSLMNLKKCLISS